MEKQKPWQFYLIVAVVLLTLFNILPTIFYYTNPLKSPIDEQRAEGVAEHIIDRVNSLEEDAVAWVRSFCDLLGIKPKNVELNANDPRLITVTFNNSTDAMAFKRYLPPAGRAISFVPSQLTVYSDGEDISGNTVIVSRNLGVHLNPTDISKTFQFSDKVDSEGQVTPLYREVINDRVTQIALGFGGPSENAILTSLINTNLNNSDGSDYVIDLARGVVEIDNTFGQNSPLTQRYFASFAQIDSPMRDSGIQQLIAKMETSLQQKTATRDNLMTEQKKLEEEGQLLDSKKESQITFLSNEINVLKNAVKVMKTNSDVFKSGTLPLTAESIQQALEKSAKDVNPREQIQIVSLEGRNPFVEALMIDWNDDRIVVKFYDDIQKIRDADRTTELEAIKKDKLNKFLFNELARASQRSDETLAPFEDTYAVTLTNITNASSFLTLELGHLSEKIGNQLKSEILTSWKPKHSDLSRDVYPIYDYKTWKELSPTDQKLGLVVFTPAQYKEAPPQGFQTNSIYLIARGVRTIQDKYSLNPNTPEAQELNEDLKQLVNIMNQNGYQVFPGSTAGIAPEFRNDLIFVLNDYYSSLIGATRENFIVKGTKRYGVLYFTDVEQRVITTNKIEDSIQEDLVKWSDEYAAAQVSDKLEQKFIVPEPTKSPIWENTKLTARKYFRGDDRKILKWGLDLSGGKTVRIGLRDQNNRPVTNPDEINQAVNELYKRVNAMGVAERTIRVEVIISSWTSLVLKRSLQQN